MIQSVIVFIYLILTVAIGLLSREKTTSSKKYDGVGLGLLICIAAGAGEWMGGTSTTGISEYGYLYGISGAWYTIANGMGICFLALFFARLFRKLEKPTVPGIIGAYVGKKAQVVSSLMLIVVMMAVGSSQMVAIGTLGESLFNLKASISILVLGSGIIIYTILGGMIAVGYTNILHLGVMYVGAVVALVVCSQSSGGLSNIFSSLPSSYLNFSSIGWSKISSWIIASVLGACTAQAGLQPVLGAKDEKTAIISSLSIAAIVAPFGVITAILGMIAKVQFPLLGNAKMALPTLLMSIPPIIGGIVMASIFAAVLSTASPIFLSCGTLFTRDIFGRMNPRIYDMPDKKILFVSRISTGIAGAGCILIAIGLKNSSAILDIVYFAYSIRGSLFIILLLGIYWKKLSQKATIISMILTATIGGFWVWYKSTFGHYLVNYITETYIALIVSIFFSVILSLIINPLKNNNKKSVDVLKGESNMKSVVEYLSDYAMVTPNKVAVIVEGQSVTYKELFEYVRKYSAFLKQKGLKKGNVVVTKASQSLDYIIIYLSVHLSGGVISSIEKSLSDEEVVCIAKKLGAAMIIGQQSTEYECIYVNRETVIKDANQCSFEDKDISFPDPEDSADILFTTGTTGSSKGVELSHRALVATAENLIFGCEYKKDTVMIAPGPLNHANAIRKLFTTFVNGSTIYILNGMANIKDFYKALEYESGTIACCLPPAAIRTIFQLTKSQIGEYSDKIDFIESATSPLPEPDKVKLCELLPKTRLYNNYGSSESASVCMYDYNKYQGKEGCIGKEMPNSKIIIVDDDKNIIKSSKDNVGLIACIGEVNMKGYVNEPLLTREILKNGILYTNDIGYMDEDGFVYVVGRKGDVINVGGLKVAPNEVESVALSVSNIDDCICLPVDDLITGKALKLLVVCEDEAKFDAKQIAREMSKKIERYKVPKYIEVTKKIERTYNGKIDRKAYK